MEKNIRNKYLKLVLLLAAVLLAGNTWGQETTPEEPKDPGDPTESEVKKFLQELSDAGDTNAANLLTSFNDGTITFSSKRQTKNEYNETSLQWEKNWEWSVYSDDWTSNITSPNSFSLQKPNSTIDGNAKKIIYAKPGDEKTLSLQKGDGADNMDGFIRWYVNSESITGLSASATNDRVKTFSNGLAWQRGNYSPYKLCMRYDYDTSEWIVDELASGLQGGTTEDTAPEAICSVTYTIPSDATAGTIYTIVCEASARNNITVGENTVTTPKIALSSIYEIHVLSKEANRFSTVESDGKTPFNGDNLITAAINNPKDYFLDYYEIHTPITTGTNYRLPEPVDNYYTASGNCLSVQWRMFDEDGKPVNVTYNNKQQNVITGDNLNIVKCTFPYSEGEDKQYTYYIAASVGESQSGTFHPACLMKVYLEPNAAPLTKGELIKTENESRTEAYLIKNGYKEVTSITFEEEGDYTSNLSPENNIRKESLTSITSSYAFIDAIENDAFQYRRKDRLSVGRGEFGLYRTLNMQGISKNTVTINGKSGLYNDWFANEGKYNKQVVDRTKEAGGDYGYFFYLDATDEPGTVTDIQLGNLCPDTRLVVSAWICDLAYVGGTPSHADVSFIFKGIKGKNETELSRFQSGEVSNVRNGLVESSFAPWQQIFFTFNFEDGDYDSYEIELVNNCPNSSGADYAIDDIQVWRSTPNIKVQRLDACDASSLLISTDYETLLNNMDWVEGEEISDIDQVEKDPDLLKYRLGLRGNVDDKSNYPKPEMKVGNAYFSFLEGLQEDGSGNLVARGDDVTGTKDPDEILDENTNEYRWIRINKALDSDEYNASDQSIYSLRIVVATDARTEGNYPTREEDALKAERILNLRAAKDYNYLRKEENWKELWKGATVPTMPTWLSSGEAIDLKDLDETNVNDPKNEQTYLGVIQDLYSRLQIPRIHCPWLDETNKNKLHLCPVDVDNTDLRYEGEIIGRNQDGTPIKAKGIYQVILFGAIEVNGWNDGTGDGPNLKDPCNLISEFTVTSSIRIRVNTAPDTEGLICAGTQRQITADLLNKDTGEPLDKESFGFDWFLGTQAEYDKLTTKGIFGSKSDGTNYTLQEVINEYRNNPENKGSFDADDVEVWTTDNETMKKGLLSLFNDENGRIWLLTDKSEDFTLILTSKSIIAMPFIKTQVDGTLYCTEIKEVLFEDYSEEVPEIYPGIPKVNYGELTDIPVRVGLRHIAEGKSLTIPLQEKIKFAVEESTGHSLILTPNRTDVTVYDENMPTVATLTNLQVKENSTDNELSLSFKNDYETTQNFTFAEGQEYILLIPFSESADGHRVLGTTCDGLARLRIKVVPEYLTWQGDATNNWYVDSNWKQSTRGELHKGGVSTQDANGSDVIDNAFSPLYFTNVTILGDSINEKSELQLESIDKADSKGTLKLGDSYTIQYDMAVTDENGTIAPYYINKVNDIYFKPGATLHRQDRLTYKKAWVDFEMTKGQPYWMSSPLKDVYAGDMYAPKEHGRQETEVFKDIKYVGEHEATTTDGILNDRWSPAFYQKAWDNAIEYASGDANNDGIPDDKANNEIENVVAVSSNWSIEYNDVTVPYSIKTTDGATTTQKLGKGFYARVENFNNRENKALVRLPKADDDYKYETRALTDLSTDRSQSGQLADKTNFTINLETDVDGDGTHFLIGNPYMAYLNMTSFFNKENLKVLDKKYWTLVEGSTEAAVGTPDVEWTGAKDAGFIAPMQAFFVEKAANVAEGTTLNVTFSPTMVATKEEAESSNTTRSYTATNPQLTLTAQSSNGTSRVAVVQRTDASNQYKSDEDAVTLLDSELKAPTVYTVAGNYAAAVNVVHDCKNIPLGVYADNNEEVELTIEGASQLLESLYLYDAVTRSTTPIEGDSYTLNLTGSSHGRYFLTTDEGVQVESDIRIYSPYDGQIIIASTPSDRLKQIQVYDMSGRLVESRENVGASTYQLYVPGGIYIVRVQSEQGEAQAKLKIK